MEDIVWTPTSVQAIALESRAKFTLFGGGRGCYPVGTEFLTPLGWKKIEDYSDNDLVMQVDEDLRATFIKPIDYIKVPVDNFVRISNSRVDFTTSLYHNHLVRNKKTKNLEVFNTLELIEKHQNNRVGNEKNLIRAFSYDGVGISYSDDYIRLKVAVFADGCFYKDNRKNDCQVVLTKNRKKTRIRMLLKRNGLKYNEIKRGDVSSFYFKMDNKDKVFKTTWYSCSKQQLEIINEEILLWDGSIEDNNTSNKKTFYSIEKETIDFIQFSFSSQGVRATISKDLRQDRGYNKGFCYILRISEKEVDTGIQRNRKNRITTKIKLLPVTKEELMYCFTVPTGIFIVRQENQIYVSKNSGKTDVAIHKMLYKIEHPKLLGLVLRKNSKDLTDFILRADKVWKYYGAKKTGSPQTGGVRFVFPNGGEVYTGHLGTPEAFEAFQGWEINMMFIEELTHIASKDLFMKLVASLRSTDRSIPARLFATSNPNGAGAEWVKEFWRIGEVEPMTFFKENGVTKLYVHANVHDNPHLMLKDPSYVKYLESLPADLRQQWLFGSWEAQITDNQYFGTIMKKAQDAGRICDVPYEGALRTFVSFDLGVKDLMVMWFYQINGREIRAVECYANRNSPLKHYSDYMYDIQTKYDLTIETVFVPHDSAVREMTSDTLMTRQEKLEELGWNVELAPRVSRDDGIEKVRELLTYIWIDKTRCKDGIHALKSYHREFDVKGNRYKDSPSHEFSDRVDSFRYGALSLPSVMSYNDGSVMQNEIDMALISASSI